MAQGIPTSDPAAWRRQARLATAIVLLVILAMGGLAWRAFEAARARSWQVAEAQAERVALALRSDIQRSVQAAATALEAMGQALQMLEYEPLDQATRRAVIFANAPRGPGHGATLVIDAAGSVLHDSRGAGSVGQSRAERDYFAVHRDHPAAGRFVSAPFRAPADGRWIVILSERLAGADGRFAGVIATAIEIDHLKALFAQLVIGAHGSVTLMRSDGLLLMRAPFKAEDLGRDLSATPNYLAWRASGGRPFTGTATLDNEERRYIPLGFDDVPLVLLVNVAARDVRAGLGAVPQRIGLAFLLLAASLLGVVVLFRRELARRAAAEAAATESAAILRIIADNSPDMITVVGPDRARNFVSEGSRHLLGIPPEAMLGGAATDLPIPEDRPLLVAAMAQVEQGAENATVRFRARHADGRTLWLETTRRVVAGSRRDRRVTAVTITRDITAAMAREAALAEGARRDSITGLLNRRGFQDELEAAGPAPYPATLVAIDLDHFKEVNDAEGHEAGDAVLLAVADRLRAAVRGDDRVARLGGDEFALLLPGLTEPAAIAALADRLHHALHEPVPWQGRALHLGATLGIARSPQDAATPSAALQAADAALVRAKRDRRGGIGMADAGEADRRGRAAAIRRQLRAEAGLDGLAVAFQPVLRCAGPEAGRPLALEAFARWSHPTLGPVPPDQLLSLVGVEEAVRFAAAARRLALAEFAALRRAGGATGRLALNLSSIEVLRPELVARIAEEAAAAGLGPGDLALEVTEAVLADRVSDRALERLAGLRAQGAQLWLDDFGTGHADLAQLLRLPLDAVKLDRRFVQALGTEARADALVRAMLALAQGLGLMVITEAVETEAQAATLRALGCDAMQGYLLARPMPAAALGAWVAA